MTIAAEQPPTGLEATPESHRVEKLQAMLDDPACAGWHDQIREQIAELTATTILGS